MTQNLPHRSLDFPPTPRLNPRQKQLDEDEYVIIDTTHKHIELHKGIKEVTNSEKIASTILGTRQMSDSNLNKPIRNRD